jgi:hypothetical protein
MGFSDEPTAIDALRKGYGNVSTALDILERGEAVTARGSTESNQYRTQLLRLEEMGFTDRGKAGAALQATNGNVEEAVERLLSGSEPAQRPEPPRQQYQAPRISPEPPRQQLAATMPSRTSVPPSGLSVPQTMPRQQQQPQQQQTSFVNDLIGAFIFCLLHSRSAS